MPELDLGPVKPIKGIDYFTAIEISTIENSVKDYCSDYIDNTLGTLNTQLQNKLEGDT